MKQIILFTLITVCISAVKAQNTAFGSGALISITTGINNSAFGTNALTNNTVGNDNVAVGEFSLSNNKNGYANIAIGSNALGNNSYTGGHIAIGRNALISNGRGYINVGIGDLSLSNNTDGSGNVAVGGNSLPDNMFGNFNTAIGMGAGTGLQSGYNNTLLGYDLGGGTGIISGSNNTIIGGGITGLASNLSNTIILADGGGNQRLYIDNNGNAGLGTTTPNTRLEVNSSISNVSGLRFTQLTLSSAASASNGKTLSVDASGNVILTTAAGGGGSYWNLTGNTGTVDGTNFIGTTDNVPFNIRVNNLKAGRLDATLDNAFYGLQAGNGNTTGFFNTAIGSRALLSNNTGNTNTAIGLTALQSNTGGTGNTATGGRALLSNTAGNFNTANGIDALLNNGTGNFNTGFGGAALWQNSTGSYNTAVGRALATNSNGNNNTGLGFDADVSAPFFNNATAVGSMAIVNASNKVRIGDVNVTVIEGQPASYTGISDGRFKTNIKEDDVKGLEFINLLRCVSYNFETKKFEEFLTKNMPDSVRQKHLSRDFTVSTKIRHSGFIAQEVEKAANEVGFDFDAIHKPENDKDNYSLAYGQFVVPLVKAVQELSKQNDELKKEMTELKALIKANTNTEGLIKFTEPNSSAKLFQNSPNPFSKTTIIRYSLPTTATQALLSITSLNGVKIKEFDLKNNKAQNVEINGGELAAGTYVYALIVDGSLIDSKKMILTNY